MSLTRQEVFQALAEDKEIEIASTYSGKYQPLDSFSNFLNLHYLNFNKFTWRIKSEPPKWCENIPEQGVLCWIGDVKEELKLKEALGVVTAYYYGCEYPFTLSKGGDYRLATPLTNEEIKQFLRGE